MFALFTDKPDPLSNCSVSHQSSESLQIACNEGFSGGLPQNFLLEIFDTSDGGQSKTNQTSMKPVFIVRGLHADTPYVAHVMAVNAKGRSEPLLVRIVTLRPPETQKNIGPGKSEGQPLFFFFTSFSRLNLFISSCLPDTHPRTHKTPKQIDPRSERERESETREEIYDILARAREFEKLFVFSLSNK